MTIIHIHLMIYLLECNDNIFQCQMMFNQIMQFFECEILPRQHIKEITCFFTRILAPETSSI